MEESGFNNCGDENKDKREQRDIELFATFMTRMIEKYGERLLDEITHEEI